MRWALGPLLAVLLLPGCVSVGQGSVREATAAEVALVDGQRVVTDTLVFARGSPMLGTPCVGARECWVGGTFGQEGTGFSVDDTSRLTSIDAAAWWNGSATARVWLRDAESGAVLVAAEGAAPLVLPVDVGAIEEGASYVLEAAPPVGALAASFRVEVPIALRYSA